MSTETPELYTTLAGEGSDEFEEKRSVFIGHAKHVHDEIGELEEPLLELLSPFQVLRVVLEQDLVIVHYRIHALPADFESDRPLDASVGEVHVSELVLRHVSVNEYIQLHILQLIAAQHLANLRKRLASMDMAFACKVLIPLRHNSSQ